MEMGVGGTGDWKCEGVEVALFCRGAPKQTLTEGGKDSSMLALWQRSVSASVGEVSSMPAGAFSLCECVVCCCCEGVGDERRRNVVTYGLPHQLTNAMDTPDVASAVAASEMRVVDVPDQSLLSSSVSAAVRAGASRSRAMVSRSVGLACPAEPIHLAYRAGPSPVGQKRRLLRLELRLQHHIRKSYRCAVFQWEGGSTEPHLGA